MACYDEGENIDKVKPLDELLDDQIKEFDGGKDRVCDKDLDTMIWELGDFENEEPPQDAEEFGEEQPIEEELMEKDMVVGRRGRVSLKDVGNAEEDEGKKVTTAGSIGPEPGRKKNKVRRGGLVGKKKG